MLGGLSRLFSRPTTLEQQVGARLEDEQVAELFFLRPQVSAGGAGGARLAGQTLANLEASFFQSADLAGIVGQQANLLQTEGAQGSGRKPVIAQVGGEAEAAVGFDGIGAAILERIGLDLAEQADPPSFLRLVKDDAHSRTGDAPQGEFELGAAITAQRMKNVSR